MILFLSLLGRAGHGKSTAARYFVERHNAKIISLAAPLKRAAQKVMGFTGAQLWGTQEEKEAVDIRFLRLSDAGLLPFNSARRFLQLLGTDGLRDEFDPDIHLDTLLKHAAREYSNRLAEFADVEIQRYPTQLYIVDDSRFPNEIAYFNRVATHELARRFPVPIAGATIKVVCTDAPPPVGIMASHASESSIDLIHESEIAATVVSSRAQGTAHLIAGLENAIATAPRLSRCHGLSVFK